MKPAEPSLAAVLGTAARGAVAAMAMSGLRKLTTGLGLVRQTPPEEIAREGLPGLIARVPVDRRAEAVELAHWAYGAAGGAAYALVAPSRGRPAWAGPLYGLVLWAVFERVVAPLLGLARAEERPATERLAIAADHVLYGAVVAGGGRPQGP